jgi:putative DNA primase/helicase
MRSASADAAGHAQVFVLLRGECRETRSDEALENLQLIANALGGEVAGRQVLAPGPGHSPHDRSLAVRPAPTASGELLIYSHSGDDWRACRDHVLSRLGITRGRASEASEKQSLPKADESVKSRIERAVTLWRQGIDPRGTLIETYLASRALALAPELAMRVIRFHAACPWRDKVSGEITHIPAMLAVMRNIYTNEVTAVQRTALSEKGEKISRMALGPKTGAAIKLSADEDVTMGLAIGEGLETVLSAMQLGFTPAWALGDASNVRHFPVVSGIGCLTIIVDNDESGTGQRAALECSSRWTSAGREVFRVIPDRCGDDINDVVQRTVA